MDAARRCANLDLPEKAYKIVGIERRFFEDYDCEAGAVRNARLYTRAAKTRRGPENDPDDEMSIGQPLKHKTKKEHKNSSRSGSRGPGKQCERQKAPGPAADAFSLEPRLQTGFERDEELAGVAP